MYKPKYDEKSVFPESKIKFIIQETYNHGAFTQKKVMSDIIETLIKALPNCPEEPSITDDELKYEKRQKKYRLQMADLKEELKNKLKIYSKKPDDESTDDDRKKYKHFIDSLSKIEHQILDHYEKKRALSSGNYRIGGDFGPCVTAFLSLVISDIFKNGLAVLKDKQKSTLKNKHVFGCLSNTALYPLYQNLPIIKRFELEAKKEIHNETTKATNTKKETTYEKRKKNEPNTNISKPTKLHSDLVDYSVPKPEISFNGSIFKLWGSLKDDRQMLSQEVKDAMDAFAYDFIIAFIKGVKRSLDFDGVMTFKARHVLLTLAVLSSSLEVHALEAFIHNYNKIESKPRNKNHTPIESGSELANSKSSGKLVEKKSSDLKANKLADSDEANDGKLKKTNSK